MRSRPTRAKEEQVAELVEHIESQIGPIDAFVFNIGANVPCSILDETARKYFKVWEMACFAGFLTSQAVAKRMAARSGARSCSPAPRLCPAGRRELRRVRHGQARPARTRTEHGARTRAAEHPRGARRRRRGHRHRIHPRQFPGQVRREGPGRNTFRRITSRTRTGTCTASRAMPGRSSSTCARGSERW